MHILEKIAVKDDSRLHLTVRITTDTLMNDFVHRYVSRRAPDSSRGESRVGASPNFMGNLQFVVGFGSISLLVIIDYPLDRQDRQLCASN